MRKIYIDAASQMSCIGVFLKDVQLVQAGTTVYSMPVSCKNEEYERWAREYDIHFIFEDDVPAVPFYAVPRFDVLAVDSLGGFIGTIGQMSDLQGDAPMGYIDRDEKLFHLADGGTEFVQRAPEWRQHLAPDEGVRLYVSAAEARSELEFLDLPEEDIPQ